MLFLISSFSTNLLSSSLYLFFPLQEMFDRGLSGIEEVWLSNNQLGDEGFGAVGEALSKVR